MKRYPVLLVGLVVLSGTLGAEKVKGEKARSEKSLEEGRDLHSRIEAAIAAGRQALKPAVEDLLEKTPKDYPMGRLALPVAALLKAGISSTDPLIKRAVEKLVRMRPEKTYCVACHLFALDALCQRQYEESLEAGSQPGPSRQAAGEIRERMAELARWLADGQNSQHGSWTYEKAAKGQRHDFSNTQFAVLGLEIALDHGIEVPREVFLRVARLFGESIVPERTAVEVEIRKAVSIEERLRATRVNPVQRYKAIPGGWAYTDSRKKRGTPEEPYASMTAAGASSLIIAIKALAGGQSPPVAEKALHAAYAWIAQHFDQYLRDQQNFYYTLYSLEKVGDLGSLEKFGERAWYEEGASRILEKQAPNGGWGGYVNTSLALLFLTRATRLFEARAAPAILTGTRGKEEGANRDLVYIEKVKGFVSARMLLEYIGSTRRPELLPIGEEAVKNYSPDSREDLVPLLLGLWTKQDRLTSFARRSLQEITGLKSPARGDYVAWEKRFREVQALEAKESPRPEDLISAIRGLDSVRLKGRIVNLAHRKGLRSLAPVLIDELSVDSTEYRRMLHGILQLWIDSGVQVPASDGEAAWEHAAKEWKGWWQAHGSQFLRDLAGEP